MPIITQIDGITIRMYVEKGGQHNFPHVHASYSGDEAVYTFDGEVMAGGLPKAQHKRVLKWISSSRKTLEDAWNKLYSGQSLK